MYQLYKTLAPIVVNYEPVCIWCALLNTGANFQQSCNNAILNNVKHLLNFFRSSDGRNYTPNSYALRAFGNSSRYKTKSGQKTHKADANREGESICLRHISSGSGHMRCTFGSVFFKDGEARNTLYHLNLITLTDKQRNKVDTDQERDPCPNFLGWLQ